jgi:predicted peroxiredoxin
LPPEPLGVLLISGGHERAHYALVLATTAAALGRPAILFATNAGVRALLADPPQATDPQEAVLAARGVGTFAELAAAAADLGVRRIACEAGLRVEALEGADLAPGVQVAGAATFLAATKSGQVITL